MRFHIVFCGGDNRDIHATHGAHAVVVDFRENQLFFKAHIVVATAIETLWVHATEIADAAYLGQLGLLFFWAVDRSRDQRATRALLKALEGASPLISLGLKMPFVRPRILAIGKSVRLGLEGDVEPEAAT